MKLELNHIVGYLPHQLEMIFEGKGGRKIKLTSISITPLGIAFSGGSGGMWLADSNFKPILRPLSDLTKEIEHNGEKFVPSVTLEILEYGEITNFYKQNRGGITPYGLPYYVVQKLYEWHFDIHKLIEKDLAININSL